MSNNKTKDDLFVFAQEDDDTKLVSIAHANQNKVWKILIVDDDADVHAATEFVLRDAKIEDRRLDFYHAYNSKETIEVLQKEKEISVIFLDVVMETSNAGLDLIAVIRKHLGIKSSRIILRTGEPNQAPGIEVIRDYDINDYKLKTEITQQSLYTCLTSAVRSYKQICAIEKSREGLERVLTSTNNLLSRSDNVTFFQRIIVQAASLLKIAPEGVLCGKSKLDQDFFSIIAATGSYANEKDKMLIDFGSPDENALIERCLEVKKNIAGDKKIALYINSAIRGELCCLLVSKVELSDIDNDLLDLFSSNISICTDNVAYVEKLKTQAFFDETVDLPNRNALESIINQKLSDKEQSDYALALIDFDNFAEINVSLGQLYGDKLLRVAADRYRNRFQSPCTVARIGGDIFAVYGPSSYVTDDKLLQPFRNPFEIGGELQSLTATVGLVPAGEIRSSGSDVIKDASIVLKQAKKDRRGEVVTYHHSMIDQACSRLEMLKNLRSAFDLHELFLVYQPKLCLQTLEVHGFEALLRWRDKTGQFISPAEFIPLAEQSGLIVRIGEWVLGEAIQDLQHLKDKGYGNAKMAVNLSVAQFQQSDLLESIQRVVNEFSIDPHNIELEITESIAMGDIASNISVLEAIKKMGFSLSMDDFGTGFSSLNYLQKMPLDCLKIDRSFVNSIETPRGKDIVQMIIQLARSLNLRVIAEGVETREQAKLLEQMDCDEIQGFLYARPMPLFELDQWLANHRTKEGPHKAR